MNINEIDNDIERNINLDYGELRQLDLNLLIALDVLIEEASVTKAANRLNLSQSAMSYSLKRLREILGDEILCRSSKGMEATPYACEIAVRIRQILWEIQSTLLEKESFNPLSAKEDFAIAMSDYVEISLGVSLLARLRENAPNIRFRTCNAKKEAAIAALDSDRVDLVIGVFSSLKSWHVKEELYREEFVCVAQSSNADTLPLAEYLERPHILVSGRNDFHGEIDSLLAKAGQSRKIVWSTPHFMTVPFLIANSECLALLPKRVAQRCAKKMGLKLLPAPTPITGFTVSMIWHQKNNSRLKHKWLREQITEIAKII